MNYVNEEFIPYFHNHCEDIKLETYEFKPTPRRLNITWTKEMEEIFYSWKNWEEYFINTALEMDKKRRWREEELE